MTPGRWKAIGIVLTGIGALLVGGSTLISEAIAQWMFGPRIMNPDQADRLATVSHNLAYFVLVFALVFVSYGALCITNARRPARRTEFADDDPRAPVLYLRPFTTDASARFAGWEEQLVGALKDIGPVVAVGQPSDSRPPLGAVRWYVPDARWQEAIDEMLKAAALVVVRVGGTQGIQWELERAVQRVPPERLLLLVPGDPKGYARFAAQATAILPSGVPPFDSRRVPFRAPAERKLTQFRILTKMWFVIFGTDWSPRVLGDQRRSEMTRLLVRLGICGFIGGVSGCLGGLIGISSGTIRVVTLAGLLTAMLIPLSGFERDFKRALEPLFTQLKQRYETPPVQPRRRWSVTVQPMLPWLCAMLASSLYAITNPPDVGNWVKEHLGISFPGQSTYDRELRTFEFRLERLKGRIGLSRDMTDEKALERVQAVLLKGFARADDSLLVQRATLLRKFLGVSDVALCAGWAKSARNSEFSRSDFERLDEVDATAVREWFDIQWRLLLAGLEEREPPQIAPQEVERAQMALLAALPAADARRLVDTFQNIGTAPDEAACWAARTYLSHLDDVSPSDRAILARATVH